MVLSDPKIFQNGEMLIGFCGSFRMGQLLEYSLVVPGRMENQSTGDYLYNSFIDAVKSSFHIGGFGGSNPNRGGDYFLIGYREEIYIVQEDYAVLHAVDDFAAIGEGEEPANAVLYATRNIDMPAIERLSMALDAASYQIASVKPPFHFLTYPGTRDPEPKKAKRTRIKKPQDKVNHATDI